MLDGVTVLNTIDVVTMSGGFSLPMMIFITGIILLILLVIHANIPELILVIVVLGIIFLIPLYQLGGVEIHTTKYQVIIDESVSFTEFSNRYDIIEQDGLIYTITEKTADTN